MNVKAFARFILLEAAIGLCILAFPLHAAQLTDIRVGRYDTFTRIVFEFKDQIQYQKPIVQEPGKLTVTFLNAETTLADRALQTRSKGLEFFSLTPKPPHLVAALGFPFVDFKLKTFTLTGPQRLVLDVYQTRPSGERITLKPVIIKQSIEPTPPKVQTLPATAAVPPKQAAAPLPEEKPVVHQAPETPSAPSALSAAPAPVPDGARAAIAPGSPRKQAALKKSPSQSKVKTSKTVKTSFIDRSLQQHLILVLIVIGCAIILLVGLLLLKRRRKPADTQHDQPDDLLQSTEQVLEAIDAKIKEKLQKYN
jgi:hypothetical protein